VRGPRHCVGRAVVVDKSEMAKHTTIASAHGFARCSDYDLGAVDLQRSNEAKLRCEILSHRHPLRLGGPW